MSALNDATTIVMPRLKGDVFGQHADPNLPADWCLVTRSSPRPLRRAASVLARDFRREGHYDFSVLPTPGMEGCWDADLSALVHRDRCDWHDGFDALDALAVYTTAAALPEDGPTLLVVYVHPQRRNRRLISDAWPVLRHLLGERFWIDYPISDPMNAVLKRVEHHLPDGRPSWILEPE